MPGVPGEGGDVFSWRRAPGQGPEWEGRRAMPFKFEMPAGRFDFDGEPFLAASRGRLGVRVQDLSEELAGYFGVKSGVLVAGVEADAPAAKAGIKAGDVITAVNGQAITEPGELRREVAKVEDGKTADLVGDARQEAADAEGRSHASATARSNARCAARCSVVVGGG